MTEWHCRYYEKCKIKKHPYICENGFKASVMCEEFKRIREAGIKK